MRLTQEMEQEIRKWVEHHCWSQHPVSHMLQEIDALRAELLITQGQRDDESGVLSLVVEERDEAREKSNEWQNKAITLEKERDQLKAENERLANIPIKWNEDCYQQGYASAKEEISRFREALKRNCGFSDEFIDKQLRGKHDTDD